jgi:hypothetical protein
MPVLVRWYLKTALVYFLVGLILGAVLAVSWPSASVSASLTSVYYHVFLVGWVTQLIAGVAIWMFPKFSQARPRGIESLVWTAYALMNAGLLMRVTAEPLNTLHPLAIWGWTLVASAILQWLAGLLIVANLWSRVKLR